MRSYSSAFWKHAQSLVVQSQQERTTRLRGRRAGQRLKPILNQLEDRQLLSTFPVTSTADTLDGSGNPTSGTLRRAVEQADAATSPSTISFNLPTSPATITLDQALKPIELSNTSDSITVEGTGQAS